MFNNVQKRILIVIARGHGNRLDPNIQIKIESIHELLGLTFPCRQYGVKTVMLYLSRLYAADRVHVRGSGRQARYQLSPTGFEEANRYWLADAATLGYREPKLSTEPSTTLVPQSAGVLSLALAKLVA